MDGIEINKVNAAKMLEGIEATRIPENPKIIRLLYVNKI
jgi:hypothetical protein